MVSVTWPPTMTAAAAAAGWTIRFTSRNDFWATANCRRGSWRRLSLTARSPSSWSRCAGRSSNGDWPAPCCHSLLSLRLQKHHHGCVAFGYCRPRPRRWPQSQVAEPDAPDVGAEKAGTTEVGAGTGTAGPFLRCLHHPVTTMVTIPRPNAVAVPRARPVRPLGVPVTGSPDLRPRPRYRTCLMTS